ncbi:MAG: glycosyltransferase family 2 protein [Deltaproteobacteria bacterium]|nr:glycosyltransferase family 2 protein [Deltaproteobacteria bacterium]
MNINRCIIIPAFNEEKQIASVVDGARQVSDADIIVIDDGSEDRTVERAGRAGAFVIRHPFNMGAGVAIQTGYKYASENHYDCLLQMDGDGQHHPAHIPDMFSMVENGQCDLAIGSRFLNHNGYQTGALKSAGFRLFRTIIRIITGESITDPTSGYRCMNRKVFQYFTADGYPWDYPDANIIIDLHRMGFKIAELPVMMAPNPEGRSMHRGIFKISHYIFSVFLSILVTLLRKKSGL